jgi:exopolyphosphatase / guanosine-5'-triphosphate,3'-diphosphate pyrophosphatase
VSRAIIDIGSNTVRLVLFGGPSRAPWVLHNEKVTARLGRALADTGMLPDKAMATALSALARYAEVLRLNGVTQVDTVATAAAREAANGAEFLDRVAALGLQPRLLSGEDEALAAAYGVIAAFPGATGVVADLGGGSIELTDVDKGRAEHGLSLPLGTLQLAALRQAGPANFVRKVNRHLRGARLANTPGQPLYLVGGSSRSLARYAMQRLDWPLDDTHGLTLPAAEALRLFRSAAQGKFGGATAGISSARLAAMPDAAALLAAVIRRLEPSEVVFSGWGLREGLLYKALSEEARAQDPLIAGVSAWVEPYGIALSVATMVAGWTVGAAPEGDERLRLAATMLALATWHVEPNLRCDLAMDWALRKRWIGIDAPQRAQLAQAARASTGRTEIPEALSRLASSEDLRDAASLGLATRLCRKLTTCALPAIAGSSLARKGGCLILTVREPHRALATDSIEKELRALAAWLGLDSRVCVDSE